MRLRELREKRGLTQQEVAKLLDMDNTTVSRHESGDRVPDNGDIVAYAKLYRVHSYELFVDPEEIRAQAEKTSDG